jgi:very-long-chain (3R)-3-hydroxyacyl-CoA dehydratase
MVLAWSAADAIRYLYFATKLVGGHQYGKLTWLRYSAFYILYPVGIAGEVGVVYNTVSEAWKLGHHSHAWAYAAAALLYIPGQSFPLTSYGLNC